MSGCVELESSMTGSTREGPLQPPEDSAPLPAGTTTSSLSSSRSPYGDRHPLDNDHASILSPRRQQARSRHKMMTPVRPPSGQPIQLTPLWEHVVRTQRFPSEVDTRETFDEISERLRDPEWEVRQHALRVLVDVLPTLEAEVVDEAMISVLPELINNLGHLAPAVRKGALDTLRVYLVCSRRKEEIVTRILDEGLTRPDALENFQTNVTLGVILSTPSLLFPSSSSPRPSKQMLRQAIGALAMRLIQLAHQEASIRSLVKIHEILGDEEFDSYMSELDGNAKRDYEMLCDVYKAKPSERNSRKRSGRTTKRRKDVANGFDKSNEENGTAELSSELNKNWKAENDFCASRGIDNEDKTSINSPMPSTRIVLETEIKFNEETAITMTIIEEKDSNSEDEESELGSGEEFARDDEIVLEAKNDAEEAKNDDDAKDAWIERRKTPRRVHFGGEIVKLRTPDSEDSEIVRSQAPQTRIPLPISPTTKMPEIRSRRSSSNPSSPNVSRARLRKTRSVSSSPKREFYTHDASLSPKKSILTRSNPIVVAELVDDAEKIGTPIYRKIVDDKVNELFGKEEDEDRGWAFEVCNNDPSADLPAAESDRKGSSNARNNREATWKRRNSTKIGTEVVEISENCTNDAKDDTRVEKLELIGNSEVLDAPVQNSKVKEEKEEIGEEKAAGNINGAAQIDAREVDEKPVSSIETKQSDPHRRSPRSPKKLAFESFPRKERNYILMELSSPVKTSSRKISESREIGEDRQEDIELVATADTAVSSRANSPMGPPADHLFVDPNPTREAEANSEDKNAGAIGESEKVEKDEESVKKVTEEVTKKKENFLESASPSPIPKFRESSWEELGLVDQEVLNDLHNKEDWRARVRGLERVASALRTSSALIAIESRLGSLLHAVLGGERSCRVAAAGMAVARVVVAGVSEEALKRRLPQVAWGLARQGGPNAAQLARVAMLRLRPALLLEQLLQPHCIKARNAKTRENALQLLIFSLVTFPSTEFKVENVASKVATMVADRRRRVRQAALDTLAVLAQIYEPEEVMQAGKLAAKCQQDGDAMLAAIRARLARKSLPMVSADGLVVYGLQISPTVQIATGPDVDWIVAGSGSVSPGTGRTRGQIIATTTTRPGVQEKNAKNESVRNVSNCKGPNLAAVGIGLRSKNEQQKPLAWQLVQHSAQSESHRSKEKSWESESRDNNFSGKNLEVGKSRLTGTLRYYRSATDRLNDPFDSEASTPIFLLDDKDVIMKQRKTEENFHRRMDEIYAERTGVGPTAQDLPGNRLESRIPVPQSRDREINGRDSRIGTSYARRRNQEENNLQNWSASSRGSEASRPRSIQRSHDRLQSEVSAQRRVARDATPERLSPTRDTYRSIYQQRRGFADGNVYREVQTAPTTTSYDVSRRRQSLRDSGVASRMPQQDSRRVSTEAQAAGNDSRSRRPSNGTAGVYRLVNSSVSNGDKSAVAEEEHNEINKRHFSVQTNPYRIQNLNDRCVQFPARSNIEPSETSSNDSSNASGEEGRRDIEEKVQNDRQCVMESFVASEPEILRPSPSRTPILEKSFDVITHETNPSRRNSIEYGISGCETLASALVYSTDRENEEYETDKGSSTDDASVLPGVQSFQGKFVETPVYEEADEDDDDDHDVDDESSEVEERENHQSSARNVAASFVSNESNSSNGSLSKVSGGSPASNESRDNVDVTSNSAKSPSRVDSVYALRSIEAIVYDNSRSSTDEIDGPDSTVTLIGQYPSDVSVGNGTSDSVGSPQASRVDSISVTETLFQPTEECRIPLVEETEAVTNTVSMILVASRPHSRGSSEYEEASFQSLDFRQPREIIAIGSSAVTKVAATSTRSIVERVNESPKKLSFTALPDELAIPLDSPRVESTTTATMTTATTTVATNTRGKINRESSAGNEIAVTEVIGTQSVTTENNEAQRRVATSRVSRIRQKTRTNLARVAPMPAVQNFDRIPSKPKPITQQCLAQLESNDWEVAMKGLKALSQIARQNPEQLDSCAPGTLGRLLGRHVRNLRSQVSRAACLAAGDVFGSQARCIDQDLDDIAGPLLHRTADTNKFLRADSNEALDRMVEHLPPNKTIGVIVHRGATHQNAIVRAATARLLASIVDRLGPDWVMSLPRDVREKLIATGAKLLMDGNLDARNHTKRMIRKLARCEGFRKALTDSVSEATLRHIDKTLKSL